MSKRFNLVGQCFGRLVVESFSHMCHMSYWKCICECGTIRITNGARLKRGKVKSCGCLQKEIARNRKITHGKSTTPIYNIWRGMIKRCENPKQKDFFRYGGRGIKVCEQWHKFENFLTDMGERPNGTSIDRINNNGNYEPTNCRWATIETQNRNRSSNRVVTYKGQSFTMIEWSEKLGITPNALKHRLNKEWPLGKCLVGPIRHRKRKNIDS